jgi:3-oxoacyl-[acyl-carrier-protein] synthase II
MPRDEVVVTGIGVVSPIGIGRERFWESLCTGRSGVGPIRQMRTAGLPVRAAAEVEAFDPKPFVKPRKNLKVMARDAQLGVAASTLSCRDAGLTQGAVDPERFGVVLGADRICGALEDCEAAYRACIVDGRFDLSRWGSDGMSLSFPLSFLKVMPNMVAAQVSIAQDARGPCNTIHQAELSSLLALSEATKALQADKADLMIAGGASSQMKPFDWVRHCVTGGLSASRAEPSTIMRPFDADRDGQVRGEGAAAFVLETRRHAEARGAAILARVLGWASTCQPKNGGTSLGIAIGRAISLSLASAGLKPDDVGHVNAHGLSTVQGDRSEARAIHACLPNVPVTAPKSYFGNLGAAGGAVEMAASVLSFADGVVPATLNYRRPDPECPVRLVHGGGSPSRCATQCDSGLPSIRTALLINWTWMGQAVAVVLGGPD